MSDLRLFFFYWLFFSGDLGIIVSYDRMPDDTQDLEVPECVVTTNTTFQTKLM